MNITIKNQDHSLVITLEDAFLKETLLGIVSLVVGGKQSPCTETPAEPKAEVPVKRADETKKCTCNKEQTDETKKCACSKEQNTQDKDVVEKQKKTGIYVYPEHLSEDYVLLLEETAKKKNALICVEVGQAHGTSIYKYSEYELLFLKLMLAAGYSTENIYWEFACNPFCRKRSLAAVRTRLSAIKKYS